MNLDPGLIAACVGIGIVVGLTGMGGGAPGDARAGALLQHPAADRGAERDLVAAAVMKPRRRAAPPAGNGEPALREVAARRLGARGLRRVLLMRALGTGEQPAGSCSSLGAFGLIAASGLAVRAHLRLLERARRRDGSADPLPQGQTEVRGTRIVPTVVVGVIGGLVVGMTSVGSGSLVIISLMALTLLKAVLLVGTDLRRLFRLSPRRPSGTSSWSDFTALTTSLIIGSVPGAWASMASVPGSWRVRAAERWPSSSWRRRWGPGRADHADRHRPRPGPGGPRGVDARPPPPRFPALASRRNRDWTRQPALVEQGTP